jgi:hypothetical protein
MKKNFKRIAASLMLAAAFTMASCNDDKDKDIDPPVTGEIIDLGDGSMDGSYKVAAGTKLLAENTYNLKGYVYVPSGVTLEIEPGTIIKGEKSTKATLIVQPGGKIMAKGTKEKPIVFTSSQGPGFRKPGDWGGIILLGNAKVNDPTGTKTVEGGVPNGTYGGNNDADNSGALSYVRIEFAGVEYATDSEINGLTLGGVGSGTQMDHIQVSYSGDDSFEWFGGTVNAKYLIAYGTWDDDFDADNGFSGKVQYGLIYRNPNIADKSGSNGFESDNNSNGDPWSPYTSTVFANVTSFGPVANPGSYTDQGKLNGSPAGFFQAGVQLRRGTRLNLFNSVIAGWPIGLIIENDKGTGNSPAAATAGDLVVSGNVIAGMQHDFQDKATNANPVYSQTNGDTFVSNYFDTHNNTALAAISGLNLKALPTLGAPYAIPGGSPLSTGAVWSDSKVSQAFTWYAGGPATGFDKVAYRGAFAPDETANNNWTSGWANFDPQNTVY